MNQRHAMNSVRARMRLRIARALAEPSLGPRRYVPRSRSKAKWKLQILDLEHGDSLTLLLYRSPWQARYLGSDAHEYSAAKLGKSVAALLAHAA